MPDRTQGNVTNSHGKINRLAVVLFNLGGPDQPASVRPFLFNLFNDPAIIGAPKLIRWILAKIISRRRTSVAQEIYAKIGGKSPLLELTYHQASALEKVLSARIDNDVFNVCTVKTFVCMRYWHPMSGETAKKLRSYDPEEIVLLPLYPQYSTTTTQSAFLDWQDAAIAAGVEVPVKSICCYPTQPGFIAAQVERLREALEKARVAVKNMNSENDMAVRVLFSAHGLPEKIVAQRKDPYPDQVKWTARAIIERMKELGEPIADWRIAYQSRVGPLVWIGPSLEDEITRAGKDGVALVVVPIAFVSEHSETLVELDMEYALVARKKGVKVYVRAPTVGVHKEFIQGLADLVVGARNASAEPSPQGGEKRICTAFSRACPARFE